MTDDTFDATEQAAWDAMKAEQPIPAEPAAAPEPAPEPADTLPAAAAPEPVKPEPATKDEVERIPLSVLLEERKEFRQRLAELNARVQAAQPKPAPTPAIDPDDHVGLLKQTAAELAAIKAEREQQTELSQIADFGMRHAAEFKKTTPDFDEAYQHLRLNRAQQLMENHGMDAQQVGQYLRQEEANILRMCAQMNVNPATFVYNLAMGAGYTKAAPAPAPAAEAPAGEQPRDPVTKQFVKADPKAKIETAAKGHDRAANPVAAAGAGQGGPIDLRALAGLDGEDFDKATDGRAWKKLWGG